MRNLKRALSLALASVMLLGMMVVGSSAAFADADEIVNKEAVEITAGLGLFAGSDGKFDPTGTVTRAQMAAVIAKMFYGSDLNADTYKGGNKFSDTVSFEGGWAEGYVNLGVEKGWFKGYGDGTFGPGNAVTTAEAVTMLINLLGVDAGEGTWPMTVMAAAEDIELFDLECELKPAPATNVALTRDQLAVMVWNALNYSADGVKGYELAGKKFDTMADAIAYADSDDETTFENQDGIMVPVTDRGTLLVTDIVEVKDDTLAKEVFEIKEDKGYITANKATGADATVIDGGNGYNIDTGLDQLGHYVTVYFFEKYENEKKPGTAYAVVEMAEYVVVEKEISKKADYMAAFGSKVEDAYGVFGYDKDLFTAQPGTYVISTDELNEEGKIIDFIAPATYLVGEVTAVVETAGKEYVKIGSKRYDNNEDKDVIVEYDGIAEDDIVVYTEIADSEGNEVIYAFKPEVVSGKVTKTKDASGEYANRIWVDGTEYSMSTVVAGMLDDYATIKDDLGADNTYDVYLFEGKVIGAEATAGNANISEVIYVTEIYATTESGNYGSKTKSYFAQGVDAEGNEVSTLIGVAGVSESCTEDCVDENGAADCDHVVTALAENEFYTFEKVTADKKQAKKDVMEATPVVDVAAFDVDEDDYFAAAVDAVDNGDFDKDSKYLTVTTAWVDCGECGECVDDDDETACTEPVAVQGRVYLNAETKFFIVDNTNGIDDLKISVYTGKIAKNFEGIVSVIATEDEDENRFAELVVIFAESGLAAEELIYVSDIAAADISKVDGGFEVVAYFTETDEFKTIVVADAPDAGFYADFEIDEDGIYDLGAEYDETVGTEVLTGMVGSTIITTGDQALDLDDASAAKIYDLRDPEVIEDSEVAEIATLKDLQLILKDKKEVTFDVIIDTEGQDDVVTHIFVKSVKFELMDCDGNGTDSWVEDDGTAYGDVCVEDDEDEDGYCDVCDAEIAE